jgi:hypothetical protein
MLAQTMTAAPAATDRPDRADPWLRTIGLLFPSSASQSASLVIRERVDRADTTPYAAIVSVVERPSSGLAVINWRDATHCRYGDQIWTMVAARATGVCAISGKPIAAGDMVYKPRPCRPMPRNAEAMILAPMVHASCAIAGFTMKGNA